MATDRDIRYTPGKIEVRRHTDKRGSIGTISGYSAVFNSRSEDLGGFTEFVAEGAFTRVLSDSPDVRGLVNHDSNQLIGRTTAGTMRLTQDSRGLRYEIDVADTQAGRDIMVSTERGDTTGSSFAFTVETDEWATVDGEQERTITAVRGLFDSGPVTFPAYPASVAEASLRSLDREVNRNMNARPNREKYLDRVEADVRKYL